MWNPNLEFLKLRRTDLAVRLRNLALNLNRRRFESIGRIGRSGSERKGQRDWRSYGELRDGEREGGDFRRRSGGGERERECDCASMRGLGFEIGRAHV